MRHTVLPLGKILPLLDPSALEVAEFFSPDRTIWILLKQVTQDEMEDLEEVAVSWSENAKDIPDDWRVSGS